ncbi:MAG TPA: kelch repeat-containing protein, partial [bacterium]|nr:kelch repeat-containing protein [bacterium]
AHTVATGDTEGTKNFTATATDPTGNTSATLTLGSTVIDKTLPTPTVTSFVISTNSGFQLPNGTHAVAHGHTVSVTTVFTVAETLGVAPIVQIGGTDMTSVACAVPATNKYCFQRLVSNTEGAGLKPLALITEDRAGNITTTTGASWQVVYDFAAPRIVSALFERTPNFAPARDAANQIQYYSIRDPYTNELVTASLTLYADEEIATGPTLTGFNLGTAAVSTDTVYFSRTLADTDAAGTYPLTISWSDRLGNSTTLGIPWQMAIDKTAPLTTRVSMDKFLYTRIPYGSNATAGTPRYNASAVEGAVTYLSGDSFKGDIKKVFLYNDNNQYVAQGDVIYDVAGLVSQPIDIQNMPAGNTLFIKAGFLDRAGNISSLSTVRFIEWIATMGDKVAGSSFENPLSYYKMNNFSFRTYVDPDYQIEDIFAAARIDQFDDSVSNTVVQPEWYEYLGNGTYTPPTTDRRSMVFDPARGTFLSIGTTYTDAGTVYEFDPATNTWRTINVDGVKPSPYDGAPIAYDTTRNKLFLFGGGTGTGAGTGDELWEFDTEQRRWTWLDDPDPRLGSPREFASMIYDPKRHRLILFGGSDGWGSGDSNETWIYYIDGYGWENATDEYEPANNPSARSATAMAYDPENDTVILFGGCYYDMDIDCNNDTWELNPNTLRWTRLYPTAPAMGIRGWHGMSYDPVREKILLYGGYDDDSGTYYSSLYQYDRRLNTWVSVTTNGATPITSGAFGIAYDTIRDRTLIWGGVDISGNSTNKVYEFDGPNSRWTELTTRVPTANAWSSDRMIFNANRGRYLLYMGNTSGNDSVWEFDPNERRWTQMTVNSGPTNKYISSYGMVHEPTGSYRTMVWGGSSSKKMYYWTPGAGDTGTWTDVAQIGTLPTAYYEVAMAYDSGHNWALLFGGRVGGTYYNGTFIYRVSDAQWFDMTSSDPSPPTARIAAAMVYDPDNTRMLLFGGRASGGSALNELWQFNLGTYQWTTVTPIGSPPPARYNHSMVYDASRKKIILYGGRTSSSDSSVLEDLWEYDIAGNRWYQIYFATGRGPGTLDDYAMAIDPSAGRVLIYDNLTNHTYALYTVVMETPAHLLKVPLRYAYGSYYVSLYDLRVDVYAGASVNSGTGGEIKHGAMLDAWYGGRWLNVASNTADFETYGSLSFSVTDQNLLSRMPVGETDTLQFAIRAKGPQGTGSTGELAVDYAEVRVKYDLYASPPAPVSEYFVGTTTQTWENARLDCRSRGMDLVTVDSWSEYNSIKGLVGTTNSYWLGYHDIYRDGEWRWVGGDVGWRGDASGYWVGNAYNQWLTGYPTSSGTDNCASFHKTNNSGNWLSSPCTSTFLYVCERHPGEKRYYASTSTANWTNANTICTNAGGKLVSINSGLEQKTIEQRISRYQNYWIGLRDTGSNYWYWSDGTLASRGLGTATIPYGYTNWITYPAARPVTSNYYGLIAGPVSSLYTDYKWADASGASAYYYVCEF